MPKIYVVSDTGHEYSKAESRGELVFLFTGKVNVFASDMLVKDIETKLDEASEHDFLLPSGNAVANCIAFTTMLNKFGKVNVLIFSFKHEAYEVRTIRKSQFKTASREVAHE